MAFLILLLTIVVVAVVLAVRYLSINCLWFAFNLFGDVVAVIAGIIDIVQVVFF